MKDLFLDALNSRHELQLAAYRALKPQELGEDGCERLHTREHVGR